MTVSVDPSSAAPLAAEPRVPRTGSRGAGLLLPNADEARVLTGEADPERAARALASGGREVVVTLGAGRRAVERRRARGARARRAAEVVDTTGAGDAFAAGLLAARAGGADPAEQLAAACALAARAVGVPGARARYD